MFALGKEASDIKRKAIAAEKKRSDDFYLPELDKQRKTYISKMEELEKFYEKKIISEGTKLRDEYETKIEQLQKDIAEKERQIQACRQAWLDIRETIPDLVYLISTVRIKFESALKEFTSIWQGKLKFESEFESLEIRMKKISPRVEELMRIMGNTKT